LAAAAAAATVTAAVAATATAAAAWPEVEGSEANGSIDVNDLAAAAVAAAGLDVNGSAAAAASCRLDGSSVAAAGEIADANGVADAVQVDDVDDVVVDYPLISAEVPDMKGPTNSGARESLTTTLPPLLPPLPPLLQLLSPLEGLLLPAADMRKLCMGQANIEGNSFFSSSSSFMLVQIK